MGPTPDSSDGPNRLNVLGQKPGQAGHTAELVFEKLVVIDRGVPAKPKRVVCMGTCTCTRTAVPRVTLMTL